MGALSFLLAKMRHEHREYQHYLLAGQDMTEAVGRTIHIRHTGRIACIHCGNNTRKPYGDGCCYPCFASLAQTDGCIIRPHTCHYASGTCRDSDWGRTHCLVPHVVYLAQTSGVKVGVTGASKLLERWGDQGAEAAIVLARTPDRKTAGLLEVELAQHLPDRTDWRKLITGQSVPIDLRQEKLRAGKLLPAELRIHLTDDSHVEFFRYPVLRYPHKARTIHLQKSPELSGILEGIKGQYLFINGAAFSVRRHSGYEVDMHFPELRRAEPSSGERHGG